MVHPRRRASGGRPGRALTPGRLAAMGLEHWNSGSKGADPAVVCTQTRTHMHTSLATLPALCSAKKLKNALLHLQEKVLDANYLTNCSRVGNVQIC